MDEDNTVTTLEQQVCDLNIRVDDLEQQGCRGSICVWRILEGTPVSVDAKVSLPVLKSDESVATSHITEPRVGP